MPVSAPFHCELISSASKKLETAMESQIFNKFEPKDLELTESIEILRLIENGYKVVAKKINTPLIDINYPKDIKKATSFLKKK